MTPVDISRHTKTMRLDKFSRDTCYTKENSAKMRDIIRTSIKAYEHSKMTRPHDRATRDYLLTLSDIAFKLVIWDHRHKLHKMIKKRPRTEIEKGMYVLTFDTDEQLIKELRASMSGRAPVWIDDMSKQIATSKLEMLAPMLSERQFEKEFAFFIRWKWMPMASPLGLCYIYEEPSSLFAEHLRAKRKSSILHQRGDEIWDMEKVDAENVYQANLVDVTLKSKQSLQHQHQETAFQLQHAKQAALIYSKVEQSCSDVAVAAAELESVLKHENKKEGGSDGDSDSENDDKDNSFSSMKKIITKQRASKPPPPHINYSSFPPWFSKYLGIHAPPDVSLFKGSPSLLSSSSSSSSFSSSLASTSLSSSLSSSPTTTATASSALLVASTFEPTLGIKLKDNDSTSVMTADELLTKTMLDQETALEQQQPLNVDGLNKIEFLERQLKMYAQGMEDLEGQDDDKKHPALERIDRIMYERHLMKQKARANKFHNHKKRIKSKKRFNLIKTIAATQENK